MPSKHKKNFGIFHSIMNQQEKQQKLEERALQKTLHGSKPKNPQLRFYKSFIRKFSFEFRT